MLAEKNVTVIPATLNYYSATPIVSTKRKKVAAYARVSTNKEEQLTNYEMQVRYYTNYILSNNDWDFVKVYADEGRTGTNTRKRDDFNDMVKDALDGKIDLIITKSVARFARNTVDSLVTVRKLKEKGVGVYFEQENIDTLDSKGELLLTIMSSLAQEGARKVSEDVTWGHRKRFKEGKVLMPYGNFLGYEKGEDDSPKIATDQARTVKLIYRLFLNGETPYGISQYLCKRGILSPMGKENWSTTTVNSMLRNKKYKGEAILQKTITIDYLTKTTKLNEGDVPMYHVKNSHEAIIPPDIFEMVQAEIKERKKLKGRHSGVGTFASKIVCGECGDFYGSRTTNKNGKKRIAWKCRDNFKKVEKCVIPCLHGDSIEKMFVYGFNMLLENKDEIIKNCKEFIKSIDDTEVLETEKARLVGESRLLYSKIQNYIDKNATETLNQNEYREKYNRLSEEYEALKQKIQNAEAKLQEKRARIISVEGFLNDISAENEFTNGFLFNIV